MKYVYAILYMWDPKTCEMFDGNKGCEAKQNMKWA